MAPPDREEMRRRAEVRLAAMRNRASRLRSRVLVGAATALVVLWVAIFVQMVTGRDPALGPVATATRSAAGQRAPSQISPSIGVAGEEHGDEDEPEESEVTSSTAGLEAERLELERLELEAAEAEELEPATTGQS